MKQKLLIFLSLIFLIIVLVGLNAASYSQQEKTLDTESKPNRSTYNAGATGTRALYDLLTETGRRPTRWQEPPSALLTDGKNKPQTFVVIGKPRREFDDAEKNQLLQWVSSGGTLVLIDRNPPPELIRSSAGWNISIEAGKEPPIFDLDSSDQKQMTEKSVAAKPVQPTIFTNQINAVQPSIFASSVRFERASNADQIAKANEDEILTAPVAQIANKEKTLLVNFPYDAGQIVFLSDPYIVSNAGINLADNAQLAVNLIASGDGIVAFDEYHQGYGTNNNRFLAYFENTPLIAIFLQIVALAGFVLFSQSRRFARPLPEIEPNRLSKLEYVAAMAEIQQRTKAFDLAIENIYTDFRRRVARLVGADNLTVSHQELARMIGERGNFNRVEIENLLFKCEDIVRGEPTNKKEVLALIKRLREVEEKLGLRRAARQTFGK